MKSSRQAADNISQVLNVMLRSSEISSSLLGSNRKQKVSDNGICKLLLILQSGYEEMGVQLGS